MEEVSVTGLRKLGTKIVQALPTRGGDFLLNLNTVGNEQKSFTV